MTDEKRDAMWINLLFDTNTGMGCSVLGPYKTARDAQDPAGVPNYARETGCWTSIELEEPAENYYSATGSAVVFDSDITCRTWRFYGPFVDISAARMWAKFTDRNILCALKLEPAPAMIAAEE
jgi:hypothetical protein